MANLHVILVKYTAPAEQVQAAIPAHREWLDGHFRSGLFVVSGPQDPPTGGLILARGDSPEQLLRLMQSDPFAQAGVAEYEVVAFRPVKRSSAIELDGVPLVE